MSRFVQIQVSPIYLQLQYFQKYKTKMQQSPSNSFAVVTDEYYIQIIPKGQYNGTLNLIYYKQQQKIIKLQRELVLGKEAKTTPLFLFENLQQFTNFISDTSNFEVDTEKRLIKLKFNIVAEKFQSEKIIEIDMFLERMNETQTLKCLNKILKRKLQISKSQLNKSFSVAQKIQVKQGIPIIIEQKDQQINIVISSQSQEQKVKKNDLEAKFTKIENTQKQKNEKILPSQMVEQCAETTKKTKQLKKTDLEGEKKQQRKLCKSGSPKRRANKQLPRRLKDTDLVARKTTAKPTIFLTADSSSQKQKKNMRGLAKQKNRTKVKGDTIRIDFQNGDYYVGQMKQDTYEGQGFYFSTKYGTYEGQWKNGKANGYGVTIDQFGNKLSGIYKNDKRQGQGIDQYANGQKYTGNFQKQVKSGYGKYEFKDGSHYIGHWKDNMADGDGKEVNQDGSHFIGHWKKDKKDGQGILFKQDKRIIQEWKNGKLVGQTEESSNLKKSRIRS